MTLPRSINAGRLPPSALPVLTVILLCSPGCFRSLGWTPDTPDGDAGVADGDAHVADGDADGADGDTDGEPWATPTAVELVFTTGTTMGDQAPGLGIDGEGNFIIGGHSAGDWELDGCTWTNQGERDAFVASFTPRGECRWLVAFGGSDERDRVHDVAVAPNGMTYAAGLLVGTVTIGEETITATGSRDALLFAIHPSGDVSWVRHVGSAGGEEAAFYRMILDGEGNPVVTGWMRGSADFGCGLLIPPGDAQDLIVASYSPDNECLFASHFGGIYQEQGKSVFAFAGGSLASGDFVQETSFGGGTIVGEGSKDAFVARLDARGELVWLDTFGGAGDDSVSSVVRLESGLVAYGGFFNETVDFESDTFVSAGGQDGFVRAVVEGAGTALWALHLEGAGDVEACRMVETPDGRISVLGFFDQEMTIGDETLEGLGGWRDVFWALIDPDGHVDATLVISSPEWDSPGDMLITPSGELYISGTFSGETTFGSESRAPVGPSDIFVVRLVP